MEQGRHGGQALPLLQLRDGALPPQGREHLAVRRVAVGGGLVAGVAVADGGAFADDAQPGAAQHGVLGDQVGQPVVDGGGGLHVGGRQAPHEAHVQHGQGRLHVVLGGVAGVEEGPDGLLGQVLVLALAEEDDPAPGDLRGERHGELVPPLPGVDRDQQVVREVQAQAAHDGGEAVEGVRSEFGAEQRGVVGVGRAGEGGVVAVGGHPQQPHR